MAKPEVSSLGQKVSVLTKTTANATGERINRHTYWVFRSDLGRSRARGQVWRLPGQVQT